MTDIKILADEVEIYENENKENIKYCCYRQGFHIMPQSGILSSPNGLCYYKNEYHVYYQYAPFNFNHNLNFWGHYSSPDLIRWKKHSVFLCPDTAYDKDGIYSGCAIENKGNLHFFYTGNVCHEGHYDYICSGREQNTIHVISRNGIDIEHKERVLSSRDYPKNLSNHVRNPKVWKENGRYYMILGARTIDAKGEAILYESDNLSDWRYLNVLKTEHDFGYMWEYLDIYRIDNKHIISFSPKGIKEKGFKFNNIYQSGYAFIEGDFRNKNRLSKFTELDRGFDFYSPQTFLDSSGKRIMFACMFVPDSPFETLTIKTGWQHCLTFPREITIKNDKIYQSPIKEINQLHKDKKIFIIRNKGKIISDSQLFDASIKFNCNCKNFHIYLRKDVELIFENGIITLKLGASGCGRKERHYATEKISYLRILSDVSSLEIFVDGQCFTTRVYDNCKKPKIYFETVDGGCEIEFYLLKCFSEIN